MYERLHDHGSLAPLAVGSGRSRRRRDRAGREHQLGSQQSLPGSQRAPGRLAVVRRHDGTRAEFRWVSARGGNLLHAVEATAPVGQQAQALCALRIHAIDHHRSDRNLPLCPTCWDAHLEHPAHARADGEPR